MTKDEALKMAQEVCPYFDERLKGAFYEGFITALDQLHDTTKMMEPSSHKDLALKYGIDALLEFATEKTPEGWKAIDAIGAMRQALAQPDMGIDRGVWSDDGNSGMQYPEGCDLVGGETDCVEEPPNSTTDVVEPVYANKNAIRWLLSRGNPSAEVTAILRKSTSEECSLSLRRTTKA